MMQLAVWSLILHLFTIQLPSADGQWKISAKVAGAKAIDKKTSKSSENYEWLDWSYDPRIPNGPQRWHEKYPECGWKRQSPVNIQEDFVGRQQCDSIKTLEFSGFDKSVYGTFSIDGALAEFVPDDHGMAISGNFITRKHVLEKVVFHWGAMGEGGSDHKINGRHFAFEMQLFHKPAATVWEVSERVVVSILAKARSAHNRDLQPVIDGLVQLSTTDEFVEIRPPVTLGRLLPRRQSFFTYNGSYPFPPCTEAVTWVIFDHPIDISRKQLAELRSMFRQYPVLKHNHRPEQPMNNRAVESRGCLHQHPVWGSGLYREVAQADQSGDPDESSAKRAHSESTRPEQRAAPPLAEPDTGGTDAPHQPVVSSENMANCHIVHKRDFIYFVMCYIVVMIFV